MKTLSKVLLGSVTTVLLGLSVSTPVGAENPAHVQQLLETGMCPGCDLSGADLSTEHLIGADLREANLAGANLQNANLEGADLTGANLEGANLIGAFLNSAELNDANLTLANLGDANLMQAQLAGANLAGANLQGTTFLVQSLQEAQLSPIGSAQELGNQKNLRMGQDSDRLTFPVGGPESEESFRYTQEYLNELFRPLQAAPTEGDSSNSDGSPKLPVPRIRF